MTKASLVLTLLASSLRLGAQSVPDSPLPPSSLALPSTTPPSNFVAAGAVYNSAGKTKTTGFVTWGKLIDAKSSSYVFTTEDVVATKSPLAVQTSVRVGVGTKLKSIGPIDIYALLDGGGATSGASSGGAGSLGSIGTLRVGKSSWYVMGGYRYIVTSIKDGAGNKQGPTKVYEFGIVRSF